MADFAVLCPGQGSQSSEMFDFALAHPRGREAIDDIQAALDFDLVARARANDRLFDNEFAQPALAMVALSTWAILAPDLPPPLLFAGYSVGEVSAWACAGAWSAAAGARVAATRAQIMDAHCPPGHGMLAVRGLRHDELAVITEGLQTAIVNSVDHHVLAGSETAIDAAVNVLAQHGANVRRLDVHVPSHTSYLAAASPAFQQFLESTAMRDPTTPVLRGIDGRPGRTVSEAASALSRAISETVRWDLCLRELAEAGVRVVLELGPGRSLSKMMTADDGSAIAARSIADFRSAEGVLRWVERQLEL